MKGGIFLGLNVASMSYEGLYFKYANDVTSTQASFIIQKLVGRDK